MQGKGLINKSSRLIGPKTPVSNPSPAQVSPDPVNDTSIINDSINKSLNKSIPPSINRSLPPTPIANVNTTPRLLSISNSTLNAKLESLESKLYGKIIAMKSYFTNELQSLKNETPGSENKDSDNNFGEKTVVENKIKLLELENKLLKDDISNKQKFIDTVLEHNGNLINNQTSDVTLIIRKRIPDSQHQSDIDRDDQREHVENKSHKEKHQVNESNKDNDKSSHTEQLPSKDKKNKDTVYILGDSMVKHVEGWKVTKSINTDMKVYVRSFSGAKVKCMKDYVKPCLQENDPKNVILHVGTNYLYSELHPERIAKSIVDVAKNIQSDTRKISISGIAPRHDNFNNKAMEVNKELSKMCNREKLLFLEHNNIKPKTHLNKSKFHLNRNGNEKLGKYFVNFINNNYA